MWILEVFSLKYPNIPHLTSKFVLNILIFFIALNVSHFFTALVNQLMSTTMLITLVRPNDVEFGYSRVAIEEHHLLLRSDSFQSEHVRTAAAMERGGDPASEKISSYSSNVHSKHEAQQAAVTCLTAEGMLDAG